MIKNLLIQRPPGRKVTEKSCAILVQLLTPGVKVKKGLSIIKGASAKYAGIRNVSKEYTFTIEIQNIKILAFQPKG